MYKHIQAHLEKEIYPFHMPGHKRNPMFFPQGLAGLDITEIPDMDILRNPSGIIRELQESIAGFYGADESYLLVNGSTAGIVAAICATCGDVKNAKKGKTLYAPRNGHVSVYSGIALSGAEPIYIAPEITPDGLAGGIKPGTLENMEEGAVVLIVSPTYEGFVSDIKEIAAIVHRRGGVLIVDEAHGAHFRFSGDFPVSALELGADIVIQSFHKTLPVLGQAAVLHVKGSRVDTARLRFYLQAVQTSSPSYMIMGQLDYVLRMLWSRPEIFETYVARLKSLRTALSADFVQVISLSDLGRIGSHGIYDIDKSKLLFHINVYEHPERISTMLSEEYRVQMEMAAGVHMLAMTSVADTDEGLQRLWGAIGSINVRLEVGLDAAAEVKKARDVETCGIPEVAMTISDAVRQETETVAWDNAAGRIAGEVVAAYPPGIALVVPGEVVPQGLPQVSESMRVVKEKS